MRFSFFLASNIIVVILIALGYFLIFPQAVEYGPQHINTKDRLIPAPDDNVIIIKSINNLNSKIKSLECEDVEAIISRKRTYTAKMSLAYEKHNKFRMIFNSTFGKELDVGSNLDYFWFWSKRMNPPDLHYATHEDLYKTRLRTPFHPVWLMEFLCVGKIDMEKSILSQLGNKLVVIQRGKIDPRKREVIKAILVDPERLVILGHYIYAVDGTPLVSSEITDWEQYQGFLLPKVILTIWYEENTRMKWIFHGIKCNSSIMPAKWEMPESENKIDMGNDTGSLSFQEN